MREYFEKWRGLFLGLALFVMTGLAYLPAIRDGGFIWDDESYVTCNMTLRDASGLKDIWIDPQATPQYYPLVHTTLWAEYQLWELDPKGYHVNNVLLHALAAVLLWFVLRRLKVPGAWLAAAIFALHPVHVESVAWITERKNVLSGVFYLGAALAYLKWVDAKDSWQRSPRSYWMAFILFIAALLSKTVTASLPAALLLVAWWKADDKPEHWPATEQAGIRRSIGPVLPLVPFFVVGVVLSGVTVWLEKHHVGAKGAEWHLSFIDRCLIAGRALWFYIGKLIWPADLCFNYPRWEIDAGVWWQYLFPLAFAALVALLWTARRRIGRGPLVAVFFFAGTLFPALGFFDVYPMRYSFVADHFNYLSSIGILVLGSVVFVRGVRQLMRNAARACFPSGAIATAVLACLGSLTWQQCAIYRNLETLWQDTIENNPASWMAFNNLGQLYINENRLKAAIPLLEQAIALNPRGGSALRNLGVALSGLGRPEEALQQYRKALAVDPNDAPAMVNIGAVLGKQGRVEEAMSYYRKALEINPDLATAHSNLAVSLTELARFDEAIQHHERALALEPMLAGAYFQFGETLQAIGRPREAADQYRKAVSLDPSFARAHNHLGSIAVADQLLPAALAHFRDAVTAAPDFAEAHNNLAKVLVSIGRTEEAEARFRAILQRWPDHGPTCNHLAVLLAGKGNNQEAVVLLRQALKQQSDDAELHNNLGVILVRMGCHQEALNVLEEAVRLKPDYSEAVKNLDDLRCLINTRSQP